MLIAPVPPRCAEMMAEQPRQEAPRPYKAIKCTKDGDVKGRWSISRGPTQGPGGGCSVAAFKGAPGGR